MKSVFLFSTKMRFFISEIPLIAIYVLAVIFNGHATNAMKLYPLQIGMLILIAFIALYFFRGIKISYAEIAHVGRFSERYKAIINKDKTLILTLKKGGKMKVVLYGNNGMPPLYSNEESYEPVDIELFTGYTLGKEGTLKRVLRFFGLDEADATELIENGSTKVTELAEFSATTLEDGRTEVRILFTKTV